MMAVIDICEKILDVFILSLWAVMVIFSFIGFCQVLLLHAITATLPWKIVYWFIVIGLAIACGLAMIVYALVIDGDIHGY